MLKLLANQRDEYHAVTGDVQYHSFTWQEVRQSYRGDVLFCPENDDHFPTLTVEETISFAARCRAPRRRLGHSREKYVEMLTDMLINALRLENVRKTLVGGGLIRGISGGEKKRLSICEVLATRPCIVSWDK